MKIVVSLSIDPDLAFNPKVKELQKARQFSPLINELIRVHLGLMKEETPNELTELKEEKLKLTSKLVDLERKEKVLEKEEDKKPKLSIEETAGGWFINEDGLKERRGF